MKLLKFVPVVALGIAGATLYYNVSKEDDKSLFGSFGGGGVFDVFGGANSGETYEVKPEMETKATEQANSLDSLATDFKTSIYVQDYKSHSRGGSSKKRTYHQNDNHNVTIVKDNGKSVGGFDFKNNRSVTAKEANRLSSGGDNPSVKKVQTKKEMKKKTSSKSFFKSIGVGA
jgi:hypothetical protein